MQNALSDLRNVERKQKELLILQLLILGILTTAVIVLSLLEQRFLTLFFLGLLAVLFCLYILDKEKELKRVNHSLIEEQLKNIEEEIRVASFRDKLSEMKFLYRIARVAVASMDTQKKLDKIFATSILMVHADRGSIMLVDENRKQFVFACAHGLDPAWIQNARQNTREGVAGWVLEHRSPLLLNGEANIEKFVNLIEKHANIGSSISAPIKIRGKVVGIFNVSYLRGSGKTFTDHDLRRISIITHYLSVTLQQSLMPPLRS